MVPIITRLLALLLFNIVVIEKQIITQVTEEASEEKEIEYSEEELSALVSYIKDITTLYDLEQSDWTDKCETVIRSWLLDTTQPLLTIFFTEELECELGVPTQPVVDMTYFLREPNQRFEVSTFHDTIIFGTIDDNIEGSMLSIIRDVYGPLLLASDHWPDSILSAYYIYFLVVNGEPFSTRGNVS